MSMGTNTANTLQHDVNAGRFVVPTLPPGVENTDIGRYLTDLSRRMQTALTEVQRAFRTLGSGSVEVTVLKDITSDGSNLARVYLPIRVQAQGATNTSNITGEPC